VTCNLCGEKMLNCDCTDAERRMYSENEDLEDEVASLRSENARLRALCGLAPKQPLPD
jgi:cell shape-determining protein MreC